MHYENNRSLVPGNRPPGNKELELCRRALELSKLAEQWSSGRRNLLNALKRTRANETGVGF
jgi:hypothetical protein